MKLWGIYIGGQWLGNVFADDESGALEAGQKKFNAAADRAVLVSEVDDRPGRM